MAKVNNDSFMQEGSEDQMAKELKTVQPVFGVWQGLILVGHVTAYIIGPLILMGLFGYWLAKQLPFPKIVFVVCLFFGFIASNTLVYRRMEDFKKRYK